MIKAESLRGALADTIDLARALPQSGTGFSTSRLAATAGRLSELFGGFAGRAVDPETLDQVVDQLRRAWRDDPRIDSLPRRLTRQLPWALFHPRSDDSAWLAREPGLVDAFFRWSADAPFAGRDLSRAVTGFIDRWPGDSVGFDRWLAALSQSVADCTDPAITPLRDRCERYLLLTPGGPAALAGMLVRSPDSPGAVLEGAGLTGVREGSEFLRGVAKALPREIGDGLSAGVIEEKRLAVLLKWIEGAPESRLRYPQLRYELAGALLRPFAGTTPSDPIRLQIQRFLLRHLGDPRERTHPWQHVPADVTAVMLRWLARVSLEDFFQLLDDTALDRHWTYRRAFWGAYLDRGLIADAWMILGADAKDIADRRLPREARRSGKLLRISGEGVSPKQSVLLMRINGVTIAEWSHNGACRMWRQGNPRAPGVYLEEYSRGDLVVNADHEQRHHGAERGAWQLRIAEWLRDDAGVVVPPGDLMPVTSSVLVCRFCEETHFGDVSEGGECSNCGTPGLRRRTRVSK